MQSATNHLADLIVGQRSRGTIQRHGRQLSVSFGHVAALEYANLSVSNGSRAAPDKLILSVGFCEFIADDCCQIRNRRIYPVITRRILQKRHSNSQRQKQS